LSENIDLLSKFICAKDQHGKPKFDDQYLLDILKNFLIAGRDTTATCLTWTLYLLSKHPDVEEKLLNEIKQVVGSGEITNENLADLKYMKQVLDESLRLHPPVPNNMRDAMKDDVLPSGYAIKAKSAVKYSAWGQHRQDYHFTNPENFDPDRWVSAHVAPYSFIPFHGGPRICLGQRLAYQEMKIALATILPKYRFRLVKGHTVRYAFSITLPMKYGLLMTVEKRL